MCVIAVVEEQKASMFVQEMYVDDKQKWGSSLDVIKVLKMERIWICYRFLQGTKFKVTVSLKNKKTAKVMLANPLFINFEVSSNGNKICVE